MNGKKKDICPGCNGTGMTTLGTGRERKCPTCGGSGKTPLWLKVLRRRPKK